MAFLLSYNTKNKNQKILKKYGYKKDPLLNVCQAVLTLVPIESICDQIIVEIDDH
jgi:hypothetical protein